MTTDFQSNLYNFISEYITLHARSPSFLEMTEAMGISSRSKSLITRSLRALNKEGKVTLRKEGRRLLISISSKKLPLVGRISAGMPLEAISEPQFIDISESFEGPNHFALQVKGISMIGDGIHDGDIIICKSSNVANELEIVVVLIDDNNATLKRISFKKDKKISLIPSNPDLMPQIYDPSQIKIQGIYLGLIRLNS
jgi:repressor LexA